MGKRIDMSGKTIERLTVLSLNEVLTRKRKVAIWVCQCSCGNVVNVEGSKLRNGTTKSCGCLRKETAAKNRFKDLTNQQFGRLTVIKDSGKKSQNRVIWQCICQCGTECEVDTNRLTTGNTQSCGCLHREKISNLTKKDLTNQRFGKLLAYAPTEKRIDGKIVWKCVCDCGNECEVISAQLLSGHTSSCGCIKNSIGESNIAQLLTENNISYIKEYTFNDLKSEKNVALRYDFYLSALNRLIEFDGEQHYKNTGWNSLEKTQHHDLIKNNYAISHKIDLVRIPYWERDNITLEMLLGDKYLIKE